MNAATSESRSEIEKKDAEIADLKQRFETLRNFSNELINKRDAEIIELKQQLEPRQYDCYWSRRALEAEKKFNATAEMVARFLIAHRERVSESWQTGFIECGAVTIDRSYPHGFVEAVKLPMEGAS